MRGHHMDLWQIYADNFVLDALHALVVRIIDLDSFRQV